jgi:hypothetical protein
MDKWRQFAQANRADMMLRASYRCGRVAKSKIPDLPEIEPLSSRLPVVINVGKSD